MRVSGCLTILNLALVMMPRVPSEPTKKGIRLGPEECFGTGRVLMMSPLGRTTSRDRHMSSILPYLVERMPMPLCASAPPTVQQVMQDGKCITE